MFLLLLCKQGFAQHHIEDSIHQLSPVEVSSDRFSHTVSGVKIEKMDTNSLHLYQNASLHEMLSQRSALYIKSNGISGLSSVSIRGTGTSHTAVLWNGFNIQNPMNGGMDISLIPVNFINTISVQYNGMAALYGSGAIGGAIHLANEPEFNKGIDVSLGGMYGSFGNYATNIKVGYSTKKTAVSLKAFYHQGKNDFPFINTAKYGSPKAKQNNSALWSYGIISDNAYKINDKNQLSLRIWLQESTRQLPTLMTQEFVNTSQYDNFLRSALEWMNKGRNYKLFVRTAVLIDTYRYKDSDKQIHSASGTTASVSESEIYFKLFPYHTMNIGMHYSYTYGYCDYYAHKQSQQEISAFISYSASNKRDNWRLNLALREEYTNTGLVPILPSFAMDIRLYKELFIYINASRNYRIPTLNDLFWFPGGNPNLKPENGYAEEIGIKHTMLWDKTRLNYSLSAYNNNIQNWIVWLPNATYWSPQNIQSVWSRGVEASVGLDFPISRCMLTLNPKIAYVKATTQKSNNPTAIGHQLIYTPELTSNMTITASYKKFLFSFNMEYVSTRYTSPDNSESVEPYILGNIQITKEFQLKHISFNLFCNLNNIWNTTYQTIVWQAMPGFNFKTGLQINFKQNKSPKS